MVDPRTLAYFGGPPVFPDGHPPWPRNTSDVRDALLRAWQDGDWGKYHGSRCTQLVDTLASFHETPEVMLTCSGTMAVELALRGVQVQPGDRVLLAAYDFPGNFRAIEAIGARPVLIDVAVNFVLSAETIERAFREHGPFRALLASHMHGNLTCMRQIMELAQQYGVAVVEDACQVTGAVVDGRRAGAWGDVGVLSFGGSKLVTAGRGGALLSRDAAVIQRARIFAERGNDAFPLSEIQAAVLLPQWKQLDEFNAVRLERVKMLRHACGELPGLTWGNWVHDAVLAERDSPSFFKLAWRFDRQSSSWPSREHVLRALQDEGLAVGEGFRGFVNRSARRCEKIGPLTVSQQLAEQTILLHHPILLEPRDVIERVAAALHKVTRIVAPLEDEPR